MILCYSLCLLAIVPSSAPAAAPAARPPDLAIEADRLPDGLEVVLHRAVQVAPAERTVPVVGDRRAIESELRTRGFREIRVVTPDGPPAPR